MGTDMDWDEYLREAGRDTDIDQIRYALDHGADPNVDLYHDGNTLLYWAASGGDSDLVRLLLQAGAQVAREAQSESTSVHVAVEHNHREILELLIAADGAVGLDWFDYLDRSPLMVAVKENNRELAEILIRAGADVNAHNEAHIGDTALKLAAEESDSEMVKLLLQAGADPLIPGWMGLTAWDKAQERRGRKGLAVRELIEKALPSGVGNGTIWRKMKG
jgi:ankyrin repeat protein